MTPEQKTAIEKAAKDLTPLIDGDNGKFPIHEANSESLTIRHGIKIGAEKVITNPSDFGLVSKEEIGTLMSNTAQLIGGFKMDYKDNGVWSEWDESVYQEVIKFLQNQGINGNVNKPQP